MKSKAIIFDLDGTLINTLVDIAAVVNLTRKECGFSPLPVETIRTSIGKGIEHLVKGCFPEVKSEAIAGILARHRELYLKFPHAGGELYPGVVKTLEALRKYPGLKVGIATNKPKPVAVLTLNHYLPAFKFDAVFGPEDVSRKKPDAAHLLETLAALKVAPENALYCGDDPVDFKTAENAGVAFLAAGWGFGGVKVNGSNHLTSFPQILPWVEKILV